MKTYHFTIILQGSGDTPEEAWADAVEAFTQDPGEPHETEEDVSDVSELIEGTRAALDDLVSVREQQSFRWKDPNDPRNW